MSTITKKQPNGYVSGFEKWVKMAELKWLWTVLNFTGYVAYAWALFISFANVDVFTRTVLSLVGLVFLIAKLVVYIISSNRKHKLEMLEIKEKELILRDREIETYERENEIIRSFKI